VKAPAHGLEHPALGLNRSGASDGPSPSHSMAARRLREPNICSRTAASDSMAWKNALWPLEAPPRPATSAAFGSPRQLSGRLSRFCLTAPPTVTRKSGHSEMTSRMHPLHPELPFAISPVLAENAGKRT
jgi:hypothetical protein